MLFLKYVSDVYKEKYSEYLKKYNGDKERTAFAMKHERFVVPEHASFDYLFDHRNEPNIWELINIALRDLEDANREKLSSEDGSGIFRSIDFNSGNLGEPKDKNARLKNLLTDFSDESLNFADSHLEWNDVIWDAYEFLIANFASDAGKKAGEFFTPWEVSTLLARLTKSEPGARICDPTCGSGSLLIKAWREVGSNNFSLYGQEANGSTWALAVMNMFLHGFDNATIRWGDTLNNPKLKEWDELMKFDTVVANPPFSLDKWGADEASGDKYNRFWRWVPPKVNETGHLSVIWSRRPMSEKEKLEWLYLMEYSFEVQVKERSDKRLSKKISSKQWSDSLLISSSEQEYQLQFLYLISERRKIEMSSLSMRVKNMNRERIKINSEKNILLI
jgi:type I restriction enzyme M protein